MKLKVSYKESIELNNDIYTYSTIDKKPVFADDTTYLITKASEKTKKLYESWKNKDRTMYSETSGNTILINPPSRKGSRDILLISAGDADREIVEEARLTFLAYGYDVYPCTNYGVNDIEKLLSIKGDLKYVDVIVSVQGFEGALPVIIAGMTDAPIISVPTSTGYGLSSDGKPALTTSLTSCTQGISVVNVDNGFGGAECAVRIMKRIEKSVKNTSNIKLKG